MSPMGSRSLNFRVALSSCHEFDDMGVETWVTLTSIIRVYSNRRGVTRLLLYLHSRLFKGIRTFTEEQGKA